MIRAALLIARRFVELPAELEEVRASIVHLQNAIRVLCDKPPPPKPKCFGTVLLLWSQDGTPACVSGSFELAGEARVTLQNIHWPVPSGAWVVALDCRLLGVVVGN